MGAKYGVIVGWAELDLLLPGIVGDGDPAGSEAALEASLEVRWPGSAGDSRDQAEARGVGHGLGGRSGRGERGSAGRVEGRWEIADHEGFSSSAATILSAACPSP